MPIRIRYNNDPNQPCTLRPTPFMSIGTSILKNGAGEAFGTVYTITLTGTLLADQGTPYATKPVAVGQDHQRYDFYSYPDYPAVENSKVGPYLGFDAVLGASKYPPKQKVSPNSASHSLFVKQKALRALFARDGQRFELSDWDDDEESIICYPRVVDISFEEGVYVDKCSYTITLEADTLLNSKLHVDAEGALMIGDGIARSGLLEQDLLRDGSKQLHPDLHPTLASLSGAFINDFSEDWSLEIDESLVEQPNINRSYRVTHSINATGKTHYGPKDDTENEIVKREAWEQARSFVQSKLCDSIQDLYPNSAGIIGKGIINLHNAYQGYNHTRTEQINQSAGSYSVTETFLLASGTAYETYNMNISSDIGSPFVSISVDGNVKGLTPIDPSGASFGGTHIKDSTSTAYDVAINKYMLISNSGRFGLGSDLYKRANASVAVQLNSQPNSVSLGMNENTGEITYNLSFDNRPTNIISGVLSENITVNDTYPGDVFAVIPVLGRPTGPVLQYIGGRTEYRREVQIGLLMDYANIPYGATRNSLMLKKPSVIEPTASQISSLIKELSPEGEQGVRKYFLSAPQETWSPKEGNYTISLSWVYELDK
tara:strand:- start:1296 stop:3095 length:1800 start_codon:yes stop_codon:yes gene_type:complete